MTEEVKKYDVIIIGAGPAGLTAALYTSRANLSVAILERGVPGGELINTANVENYPGFKSVSGPDLANKFYEGAMQFGADYIYGLVQSIQPGNPYHTVVCDNGTYQAKAVVIATGSVHRTLDVPGEEEYTGRGVSYCAVCDGAFFKGLPIQVVGGGDSAVDEGLYLTQFGESVNIIHRRDQLRAQKILQDRAFSNEKMTFTWNAVVTEIKGDGKKVTSVCVKNTQTGEEQDLPAGGVFIYVGVLPNTEGFRNLGITDDQGWVLTDEDMHTSVLGIFACGAVRSNKLRQISTAVGDGGIVGQEVYQYVETLNNTEQS